ncbi:hypothetical protein LEP1GSC080_0293 [Leptospira interrogans str. FPW2026]|nr:hypothetical protein LEP1GSC080_0293 [Leptospira interrogans str. FPW2026]
MSKKEYTNILKKLCNLLDRVDGTDFSNGRASQMSQTSPPKNPTSPSKKATSLPLRLGFAWPSPRGRRPPTLLFCRGLDGVSKQNTHFTPKKGLLGRKKLPACAVKGRAVKALHLFGKSV